LKSDGLSVYLTAKEMSEVDKAAMDEFGVDVVSLMEIAGVGVANLARRMLGNTLTAKKVSCLVGKGNNGGDGLVAARHLHNWGANVAVVLGGEKEELRDVPARQLATVEKMGIETSGPEADFGDSELLVDALLGYGSVGDPREPVAGLIRRAVASGVPILAVDLPSGLDATTGEPGTPCIKAKSTLTFGFPKTGFLNPNSRKFVGDLYLADISIPREIYLRYHPRRDNFGEGSLVRIA
jgi:NAD(P)H-hydrate epimerase